MITARDIVAAARQYIGTPYQHQRRVRGVAVDCAGVPSGVAEDLGLDFEDFTAYAREPDPQTMQSYLDRNLVRVLKSEMRAGDVAWIRFARRPQHLGIIGDYDDGQLSLIHAHEQMGAVVEHRLDTVWLKRIVAVWRYKEVA